MEANLGNPAGSVAPGDRVLCDGAYAIVGRVVVHGPNTHSASPIVDEMYAVEAITPRGSRWAGGTTARINASLRAEWSRPDTRGR